MANHNKTGQQGESFAVQYLSARGYVIMHQNWRHRHWEVDIIAEKNNILHFIEVKTRKTSKFGYPEEAVSKKKMQNLINAAAEFLYLHHQWKRIQFDILSITIFYEKETEYFLIEDVYL